MVKGRYFEIDSALPIDFGGLYTGSLKRVTKTKT